MQGPRRYFTKMWNWAEIIMLSLFALTFVFWIASAVDIAVNDEENLGNLKIHSSFNIYRIQKVARLFIVSPILIL